MVGEAVLDDVGVGLIYFDEGLDELGTLGIREEGLTTLRSFFFLGSFSSSIVWIYCSISFSRVSERYPLKVAMRVAISAFLALYTSLMILSA